MGLKILVIRFKTDALKILREVIRLLRIVLCRGVGVESDVALCCNPLTLQPERSGRWGSNPTSIFKHHDKGLWTRLALTHFCDPS